MYRRDVISVLGAATVAPIVGCLGTGNDSSTTTTATTATTTVDLSEHTVTVTRRITQPATGLMRLFRAADGGNLSIELTCPDGTTKTATADAPGDEWAAFERRVVSTDVAAFDDVYECEGDCPTDTPPTRLEFNVDGDDTEVLVEPTADRPDSLDAILNGLDALAAHVDAPTCE